MLKNKIAVFFHACYAYVAGLWDMSGEAAGEIQPNFAVDLPETDLGVECPFAPNDTEVIALERCFARYDSGDHDGAFRMAEICFTGERLEIVKRLMVTN